MLAQCSAQNLQGDVRLENNSTRARGNSKRAFWMNCIIRLSLRNAPVRIYWFSDRIEIQNPGGPFGQVNRSNFGTPGITDYRNPHIAEAMKNLGYVQRFGIGISLAQKELRNNGNPPAEFQAEDTYVLVILRKRP